MLAAALRSAARTRRVQRVRPVQIPMFEAWSARRITAAPGTRSDRAGCARWTNAIAAEGPAEIQRIRVWRSRLATTDLRIDPAGASPSLPSSTYAQDHSSSFRGMSVTPTSDGAAPADPGEAWDLCTASELRRERVAPRSYCDGGAVSRSIMDSSSRPSLVTS